MSFTNNKSIYLIVFLICVVVGIQLYTYSNFKCADCPICPVVKDCPKLIVPSSQGIVNYLIFTFANDIEKLRSNNINDFIDKYLVIDTPFTSDNAKQLLIDKIKKQISQKYLLDPNNVVFLNMSVPDREKFKLKFNIPILPNPLFVITGLDLIFGFNNDPSVLKVFINQSLF
jgi:hypothetical protein